MKKVPDAEDACNRIPDSRDEQRASIPIRELSNIRDQQAQDDAGFPLTPNEAIRARRVKQKAASEPLSFDPARLRLRQDFDKLAGVKKLLTVVPVRRPDPLQFIRVNPDPGMWLQPAAVLEFTAERESFLIAPEIYPLVANEAKVKALFLSTTRDGVIFFWPINLPGPSGQSNSWNDSALDAARMAMEHWIRVRSNRSLGAYEIELPEAILPDPVWPDLTFARLIELAFKDRLIDSEDHPVLRRLRGQL
jgi:hypothetical protein